VYVLGTGRRGARIHAGVRARLRDLDGIDLFTWLEHEGEPLLRGEGDGPPPTGSVAVLERGGTVLRFRPGAEVRDRRGAGWELEGDTAAMAATVEGGVVDSEAYPDGLARLWNALTAPHAGEILMSADPGYEFVDWGGMTHCPGGSHGALHAGDSLGPLLLCGFDPDVGGTREQWAIRDVAELVLGHFDIDTGDSLASRVCAREAVR
jgi:hypothetical protein